MTHRQVLPPGGQTTNYNINKSTWSTELLMTVRLIYVEVNIYTICNRAYISPQVKWAVNLGIAYDDFDFPQWFKFTLNLLTGLNFIQHIQLIKHHIHHKCIKKKNKQY